MLKYKIDFILFLLFIFNTIFANTLEDRAYIAFKNHNYTKSISIYKKLAKQNSLKAILILGSFYESGVGIKKDINKAKILYKFILKKTSNIKNISNSSDYKNINYSILASKRLYYITKDKKYKTLFNRLKKIKNDINLQKSELFNSNNSDYFILCPKAQIIKPKYQEGIEEIECSLFEKYPNIMNQFMKLRYQRFKAIDTNNKKRVQNIDKKIYYTIKPIIQDLQDRLIECYIDSQTQKDLYNCNYEYYTKSDPLLFQNRAFKLKKYLQTHSIKDEKLTPNQKDDIIEKLVALIAKEKLFKIKDKE